MTDTQKIIIETHQNIHGDVVRHTEPYKETKMHRWTDVLKETDTKKMTDR